MPIPPTNFHLAHEAAFAGLDGSNSIAWGDVAIAESTVEVAGIASFFGSLG